MEDNHEPQNKTYFKVVGGVLAFLSVMAIAGCSLTYRTHKAVKHINKLYAKDSVVADNTLKNYLDYKPVTVHEVRVVKGDTVNTVSVYSDTTIVNDTMYIRTLTTVNKYWHDTAFITDHTIITDHSGEVRENKLKQANTSLTKKNHNKSLALWIENGILIALLLFVIIRYFYQLKTNVALELGAKMHRNG